MSAPLCLHGVGARLPGPGGRWLFRDLDLSLTPGRAHVVVGPNGAGKTTLVRLCAGLRRASEGHVRLGGEELASIPPRSRARHLAVLPQTTPLVEDLRVGELVMLGRIPHLGSFAGPGPEDRRAVADALARAGVSHLKGRHVFTLSGGEYQRVRIARLLATGATTLLLDEPTAALDVAASLRILELLRALATDGHALLVVLHDLELARRLADFAICLPGPPGPTADGDAREEVAGAGEPTSGPSPHADTRGSSHTATASSGAVRSGPAAEILTPRILEPIFQVRVTPYDDALAYHLPQPPTGSPTP